MFSVEPGVTNANVSAAVGPGFFYPPDPSSQIVCSIGGNVAENSGGAHCFKYGFTTNYVCGLEVVLSDGEVVQLGGKRLDTPGYDLLAALVGSEGTLGVVTKIWLRVMPVPESVELPYAAALPEVACTVWSNLVMTAGLSAGEWVLIHGGASGVDHTPCRWPARWTPGSR